MGPGRVFADYLVPVLHTIQTMDSVIHMVVIMVATVAIHTVATVATVAIHTVAISN